MKTIREPSVVLSLRAYKEADLILTILGAHTGKYTAIAKHARGSRKRFFGGIDLFDCGSFLRRPSSRDPHLAFLDGIEERSVFPKLREDLEALSYGSFCLEISEKFTALEDPEGGALFRPLVLTLRALGKSSQANHSLSVATYYSLLTLRVSGYNLLDDSVALEPEARVWFEEMAREDKPIIPFKSEVAREGFLSVIHYLESTLGEGLKTSAALRRRSAKLAAPR